MVSAWLLCRFRFRLVLVASLLLIFMIQSSIRHGGGGGVAEAVAAPAWIIITTSSRTSTTKPEHGTASSSTILQQMKNLQQEPKQKSAHTNTSSDRRRFLLAGFGAAIGATRMPFLSPSSDSVVANAVVVETDNKIFTAGQALGIEASRKRFISARESLNYLLANYDDIVKNGGGDNIRRYLGTVGTTSGLYGITKVLKELQGEANDIVEYTENMNDFDYSLRAADTAAYSSNFVEFSAASTKPEKFYKDAKYETQQMKKYLDNMANEINI